MSDTGAILKQVETLVAAHLRQGSGGQARKELLKEVCALLERERDHYNWVGVYFLEGKELVLGPFVGAPSPHTRIPLDKGICGAAVREGKTVIVPDVNADPRYLACSVETKSEIVVPIEYEGHIRGEIDVDSHQPDAFHEEDHRFLEQVAQRLAPALAREGVARS
ncbi:MAG: GAF domain-containing protein [Terriglobia bacterium]